MLRSPAGAAWWPLALGLVLLGQSCQVQPPQREAQARIGTVRAGDRALAELVAQMADELAPRVQALLPDSHAPAVEVWVQETPALYRFPSSSYQDADGFYAASLARIHLRARCDDIERTLAHELVHASLGPVWRKLPGTIEEGLCDVVACELLPQSAPRLRAGRLSSAAFALGGLSLDLDYALPGELHATGMTLAFSARVRLEGTPTEFLAPSQVFQVPAGLSSTELSPTRKKALYGLACLVVDRIVRRQGLAGLHALCVRAEREGKRRVPEAWLLEAGQLDLRTETWRAALAESLGPAELCALVRLHPGLAVDSLAEFLAPHLGREQLALVLPFVRARVSLPGGRSSVDLLGIPEVQRALFASPVWAAEDEDSGKSLDLAASQRAP